MEESLAEIRKDTARRTKRSQQVTLQLQRYEKDVENVRGEVTEARELHQKVSGKRNLFDGAANGIASGIAIGVISASTLYHLRRHVGIYCHTNNYVALGGALLCTVM